MMKGQLAGLMKQAQAMQDNMKRAHEELALVEVEGQSGAGLVKVTMTCKHAVKRVAIDPSLLADDKDMLEDLVAAAFNDAVRRAEEVSTEKDGQAHRWHAAAAGHEAAVLIPRPRAAPWPPSRRSQGADRRAAPPARRGRQVGAAHGLSPAAARPRRCAPPGRRADRMRCSACGTASAATPSPKPRSAAPAWTRGAIRSCCAWWKRRPTRPRWNAVVATWACTSCSWAASARWTASGPTTLAPRGCWNVPPTAWCRK